MNDSPTCPACTGPRDPKALYCPFCGAVFNRLTAAPPAATGTSAGTARVVPESATPATLAYAPAGTVATAGAAGSTAPAAAATVASPAGQLGEPHDIYRPPLAAAAPTRPPNAHDAEARDKLERKMNAASLAAIFVGFITLLMIGVASRTDIGLQLDAWTLIDVALVFALAFGVRKRSRACATLLFVYWVLTKTWMWYSMGTVRGLPMALLLGIFFFRGMKASFDYRALERRSAG